LLGFPISQFISMIFLGFLEAWSHFCGLKTLLSIYHILN